MKSTQVIDWDVVALNLGVFIGDYSVFLFPLMQFKFNSTEMNWLNIEFYSEEVSDS